MSLASSKRFPMEGNCSENHEGRNKAALRRGTTAQLILAALWLLVWPLLRLVPSPARESARTASRSHFTHMAFSVVLDHGMPQILELSPY